VADRQKILIVDDEPANIKLLEAYLEPLGYETRAASGGPEALKMISEEKIDLVLADVMMPGMDGFKLCHKIKSDDKTKFLPVVIVTALKEKDEKLKGIEAGADDFLSKPVDKAELVARVRSILRIKSLHDELGTSYEKLKDLERVKDGLTSMIVHDFNNLLAVIDGGIQLLAKLMKGKATDLESQSMEKIISATRNAKSMAADILDINMLEEGRLPLKREETDIGDIVKEISSQMEVMSQSEGIKLALDIAKEMPRASIDRDMIRRVMYNLINNAIKYTPRDGIIKIEVTFRPDEDNYYVRVRDTGEGIREDQLDVIFRKFVQVGSVSARRGRGLGLAFCRMAVEAHGGRMWAESRGAATGSTFIFTIPHKARK
jgi:two-component system, sensor histidine kinase and response regulator